MFYSKLSLAGGYALRYTACRPGVSLSHDERWCRGNHDCVLPPTAALLRCDDVLIWKQPAFLKQHASGSHGSNRMLLEEPAELL
jgi:hypothetical protein